MTQKAEFQIQANEMNNRPAFLLVAIRSYISHVRSGMFVSSLMLYRRRASRTHWSFQLSSTGYVYRVKCTTNHGKANTAFLLIKTDVLYIHLNFNKSSLNSKGLSLNYKLHPLNFKRYFFLFQRIKFDISLKLRDYSCTGFHRTYATGASCQQRTLTPPDTWSCPILGLACVLMSRQISPELVLSPDFWISNTPRYFSFA